MSSGINSFISMPDFLHIIFVIFLYVTSRPTRTHLTILCLSITKSHTPTHEHFQSHATTNIIKSIPLEINSNPPPIKCNDHLCNKYFQNPVNALVHICCFSFDLQKYPFQIANIYTNVTHPFIYVHAQCTCYRVWFRQ